jgi:hypothetical protein
MITRKHFRPAMDQAAIKDQRDLAMVVAADQAQPVRVRPVTYTQPEGPTFVGSYPTAPFGEDPTDPTTQAQPRTQASGMVGRLNADTGTGQLWA